jgi:regulator of sigma E protease
VLMLGYLMAKDYRININFAADYNFVGVESVQLTKAIYLSEILADGAAGGKLKDKDVIIALNGKNITSEEYFRQFLLDNQGKPVSFDVVSSDTQRKTVDLTLKEKGETNQPILGAKYQTLNFQYELAYPRNITAPVSHVWNIFAYQIQVLGNGFKLAYDNQDASYAADQASSIVAIGVIVGQLVESGQLDEIINLTALVSISLAFFNLLPIPLLDGGQIVIYSLKSALGRRFNSKIVEAANIVSFVVLIVLSILLIVRDFIKFEVFSVFFK